MAEEKKKQSTTKKSNTKGTVAKKASTVKKSDSVKKNTTQKKTTNEKKKSVSEKTKDIKIDTSNLDNEIKRDSIKIEIDKKQLIKGVILTIGIAVLCLICFYASSSNSSKYSDTPSSSELTESSDTSSLEQATKEAGEVSDEERVEPNKISVDKYIELYNDDSYSLVLLSKESCGYCQIAIPIIENIIYESGVEVNLIDVGSMSSDETSKLIQSDSYFSEGYGTPLMMVVGNNSIKDKIEGLTTKEGYESFFKQNGFME